MRRAGGAHDVVDARRREIRDRRTPASRRRAAGASSCGPARAARASAPGARLLGRATARDDLYASLMIPTTVAEAARRFGDRIAYVTESGWSLTLRRHRPHLRRGRGRARPRGRRRGRRRRARAPARPRVPPRVLRGRQARRDHRGRERPALATASARPCSTLARPEAHDRRPRARVLDELPRRAAAAPPPLADDPDRPVAIIFTSGTTGLPKGARLLQPPARVHHADRHRRRVGHRRPLVQRHVVRAPRLHDEAARAACSAAAPRSSWNAGARATRSSCSPASR